MSIVPKTIFLSLLFLFVPVNGALLRLAVRSAAVAQSGLGLRGAARACATGALSPEQRKLVEARIAWLEEKITRIPECSFQSVWSFEREIAFVHTNRALREYTQELFQLKLRLLQK